MKRNIVKIIAALLVLLIPFGILAAADYRELLGKKEQHP